MINDLAHVSEVLANMLPINSVKRVLNAAFEEVDVQKLSLSLKSARTGKEWRVDGNVDVGECLGDEVCMVLI